MSSEDQPQSERKRSRSPKKKERKGKKQQSVSPIKTNRISPDESNESIDIKETEPKEDEEKANILRPEVKEDVKHVELNDINMTLEDEDSALIEDLTPKDESYLDNSPIQADNSGELENEETFEQTDGSSVSLDI